MEDEVEACSRSLSDCRAGMLDFMGPADRGVDLRRVRAEEVERFLRGEDEIGRSDEGKAVEEWDCPEVFDTVERRLLM